ncbi:MAG: DUF305 domain-containing protein [Acidobacteria bacterium]|nr:MAG: DUF305 domain-containing protein [Acidobacteriota bacterium]
MRVRRMVFTVSVLIALGALSVAQNSTRPQGDTGQNIQKPPAGMSNDASATKNPDQMFMMKAAQGGMAEVKLGDLAKQNGKADAVKQFGNRMVTDHTKANDELQQLASQKGVALPAEESSKDKRTFQMLKSKKGSEFDKTYMHEMVKDHETDVEEFRWETQAGKDPDVRAWAQKTLPVLEQHLASAKEIAGQIGAPQK